ncbi:hypothetical protein EIP86_007092 [Pleurotus ostreatoroseus]|nr:hypothetical protein EIP86_007092 [Pleurotus ostreatoroseus]
MYQELYDEQGFVIVPSLIPPYQFDELKAAAQRTIDRTRAGSWTHRRTVGRQFPPFDDDHPDSWGVQHVMHPQLGERAFAEWYTSDELLSVVKELLSCGEEDLQMELFNMLINPLDHEFALRWHRDDVKESATEQEEREALTLWHHGVQWNTALYEDGCLYVVPGSHLVPRTAEQRARSCTLDPPKNPLDMPGAIKVTLQPGETVFYNSNILHCGAYTSKAPRATLHACIGSVRGGSARARNVLQHGLSWMTEPEFHEGLNDRGKAMLDRLKKMRDSAGEVGYSQDN